jgi:hypothetical protein
LTTGSALPILPQSVPRGFPISWLHWFASATACQVARPPVRIGLDRPAFGDFYFQAFNGSVSLSVAGYNYNSSWISFCWRDLHPLEWQLASLHGQTRKSARLNGMSVLPPTADVVGPPGHVPGCAISGLMRGSKQALFDHRVGAGARGLILATPLSEDLQSAASSLIAHPERSIRIS